MSESIISSLPPQLQDSARHLLLLGVKYRKLFAELSEEVASADLTWNESFHSQIELQKQKLLQLQDVPQLILEFKVLKETIQKLYFDRTQIPSQQASAVASSSALEEFRTALESLKSLTSELSVRFPWELNFACERDPDGLPDSNAVVFGGRVVNADGSIVFEDVCSICSLVVQEGFKFGHEGNTPRIHCLNCRNVTVCSFCYGLIEFHYQQLTTVRSTDELIEREIQLLLQLNPHLEHSVVTEYNEPVLLREAVFDCQKSLPHLFKNAFEHYKSRPCFGVVRHTSMKLPISESESGQGTEETELRHALSGSPSLPCDYTTYEFEYKNRILPITKALSRVAVPQDRIAVCVEDSRLFYDIEISVLMRRGVSVSVPTTWAKADWMAVVQRAQVTVAFISQELYLSNDLESVVSSIPSMETIVLISNEDINSVNLLSLPASSDARRCHRIEKKSISESQTSTHIAIHSLTEFLQLYDAVEDEDPELIQEGFSTDETIVLHSSGTTGTPKGLIQEASQTLSDFDSPSFNRPIVEMSYLPPCWGTDKLTVYRTLFNGGRISFASTSSCLDIFSCCEIVQPTSLIMMPVVAKALKMEYDSEYQNILLSMCPPRKADPQFTSSDIAETSVRMRALNKVSRYLGGRCRGIGIGGAMCPHSIIEFLRSLTPAYIANAYGTSESSGITSDYKIVSSVDVKLLDRPDLGYTNADKPFPRGEICVKNKSSQIIQRNWLCTEEEREAVASRYMPDGYFKTGDIGMMPSAKELIVIDRASALIKLSNGQFLSPERVELQLGKLPGLESILITPEAEAIGVIAIIVPSPCQKDIPAVDWLARMYSFAREKCSLQAYEIPMVVIIERESWTVANGSLLFNLKINRRAIQGRHKDSLSFSVAAEAISLEEIEQDRNNSHESKHRKLPSMESLVFRLISNSTGILEEIVSSNREQTLVALGVDSMAILRIMTGYNKLVSSLQELYHIVHRPAHFSLAQTFNTSPAQLISRLEELVGHQIDCEASSEIISGPESSSPVASGGQLINISSDTELTELVPVTNTASNSDSSIPQSSLTSSSLNKLIDCIMTTIQMRASQAITVSASTPRHGLLLTGSTGYFGKFFAVEILRQLLLTGESSLCDSNGSYPSCSILVKTITCLVRATSLEHAMSRVRDALVSTKLISLEEVNQGFKTGLLLIQTGDITETSPFLFGLPSASDVAELAAGTCIIVHAAASVKFLDAIHGFDILAGANIGGTANVLQLACAMHPPCPVVHISTVSCHESKPTFCQSTDGLAMHLRDNILSSDYISRFIYSLDAYSLTKHVAEVLVRRFSALQAQTLTPASATSPHHHDNLIIRLPLLTWSAAGVANSDDWLQRLVSTCLSLQVYPTASSIRSWKSPIGHVAVDVSAQLVQAAICHTLAPASASSSSSSSSALLTSFEYQPTKFTAHLPTSSITVTDVLKYTKTASAAINHDRGAIDSSWACEVSDYIFLKQVAATPSLPFSALADMFLADISHDGSIKSTATTSLTSEPAGHTTDPALHRTASQSTWEQCLEQYLLTTDRL